MAYKIDSTKFFSLRTGNLLLPFFSKPLSAYTFIHLRDMKQLGLNERCPEEIAYRGYLLTPSYACSPLVQNARAVSPSLNHCLPTTKPSLRAQSISGCESSYISVTTRSNSTDDFSTFLGKKKLVNLVEFQDHHLEGGISLSEYGYALVTLVKKPSS
jgi:hypothetical protein